MKKILLLALFLAAALVSNRVFGLQLLPLAFLMLAFLQLVSIKDHMKKLVALTILTLAYTASAQTNIAYRITVDGVNTSWSYDAAGLKKDQIRVAGIVFAYEVYKASLPTNEVALAMGPWLKRQHAVLIDDYAQQKQQADNAALLAKLTLLLTVNSDLLSKTNFDALEAVAAKAP